jgi:hypothetical protein
MISPQANETLARLDARLAHYFRMVCHGERGRGPAECPGCRKILSNQRFYWISPKKELLLKGLLWYKNKKIVH